MTRRIALLALVAVSGWAVSGCTAKPLKSITVVLLDRQTVAPEGIFLPRFQRDYERVVTQIAEAGGRLYVDLVDSNPLGHDHEPVMVQFSNYDSVTGNKTQHLRDSRASRAIALNGAARLLGAPVSERGVDLVSGMSLAERVFLNYPRDAKTLVLFSGMYQQTPANDFLLDDPASYQAALIEMVPDDEFPDLAGTNVYVIGAGIDTTNSANIDVDRTQAIEKFWRAWFARAHTTLKPARYSNVLIRYP